MIEKFAFYFHNHLGGLFLWKFDKKTNSCAETRRTLNCRVSTFRQTISCYQHTCSWFLVLLPRGEVEREGFVFLAHFYKECDFLQICVCLVRNKNFWSWITGVVYHVVIMILNFGLNIRGLLGCLVEGRCFALNRGNELLYTFRRKKHQIKIKKLLIFFMKYTPSL